jgi:hypothetical protein
MSDEKRAKVMTEGAAKLTTETQRAQSKGIKPQRHREHREEREIRKI